MMCWIHIIVYPLLKRHVARTKAIAAQTYTILVVFDRGLDLPQFVGPPVMLVITQQT
jgi:hypothetical protein